MNSHGETLITSKAEVKSVEKICTDTGWMAPVYRDWDDSIECPNRSVRMIYITTVAAKSKKDIILHKRRNTRLSCVSGAISVEISLGKEKPDITRHLLDVNGSSLDVLHVDAGIPFRIVNEYSQDATILSFPDLSWHPDVLDESSKFSSWNEFYERI
tara:strand:- start:33 stop:503 length:471 start_codon:yes stop_codon:yes gene_type:complete